MAQRIIDVHVHASSAQSLGPPPLAFDLPMQEQPVHDPAESYVDRFMASFREPRGDRVAWSPMTDDAMRDQTLEIMERRNIVGRRFGGARGGVASDRPGPRHPGPKHGRRQRRGNHAR